MGLPKLRYLWLQDSLVMKNGGCEREIRSDDCDGKADKDESRNNLNQYIYHARTKMSIMQLI